MRQRFGWMAAIGLTSIASPAFATVDDGLSNRVEPEFDSLSALIDDLRLDEATLTDFDPIALLSPIVETGAKSGLGTPAWGAMIRALEDASEGNTPLGLTSDGDESGLSSGQFQSTLALAAADEGSGDRVEDEAPFDISATITGVSDYRFRGLSLSDRDPAIQGSVDIEHQSGFYAGVWGSTIAEFAGAHTEVDVYGGWRGSLGGLEVDAGVIGYFYPSGQDATYFELLGSLGYTFGPVEAKLGVAYAPDQSNIGSDDSLYAYGQLKAGIPGTPVTLIAQAGHEDGSLGGPTGEKWDWSLGAQVVKDRFTLGLSYVDTNINRAFDPDKVAHAGVVLSLSIGF